MGPGGLVCVRGLCPTVGRVNPLRLCVCCRGRCSPQLWSWQCLINELITAAERTEVRYAEELLEGCTVVEVDSS